MASKNSITNFRNAFNGGTRANRFVVIPSWPSGVNTPDSKDSRVTIFSSSLPRVSLGTVAIPYRGRAYYLPGDRDYSVWGVSVYDDTKDRSIWKAFNKWKELLDGHQTHTTTDQTYKNLQKDWSIQQLNLNGTELRTVTLYNCWPSEIQSITFDMGSTEPVTFGVSLTFDHIKIT